MPTIDEAVAADDKKISSHSAAEPASEELKQGGPDAGEVEVAAAAPKKKRAPAATPRKKKVVMESRPVEPETPRHSVSIEDPLFFAGLNVVHRKMQQDARRTKLSSLLIV